MLGNRGTESEPFVELNRQFRKLEQKAKAEEAAFESYTADLLWGRSKTFNWESLAKTQKSLRTATTRYRTATAFFQTLRV